MQKIGDLTGKRFGKLTVLEFAGTVKDYQKTWKCKCDCGNIKIIRQQHLVSGHTTTCGCGKLHLDNYVGRRFGHLFVLDRVDDYISVGNGKHYVRYRCRCDCGTEKNILGLNLRTGGSVSCGCQRPHAFVDLSGQRFGNLTVVKRVNDYVNPSGRKLVRYLCKCDCGNEILALANILRMHEVLSCGCKLHSHGEDLVSKWLSEHNLKFESHKTFSWCLSQSGNKMSYDFLVPDLNLLIECNGIQHYEPVEFFGGEIRFQEQQAHDALKKKLAYEHNYNFLVMDCRHLRKHSQEQAFLDELNKFITTIS